LINLDSGPGPGFPKNSWPDPGPGVQEKSRSRNYPGLEILDPGLDSWIFQKKLDFNIKNSRHVKKRI
jgi:hypothetical protein